MQAYGEAVSLGGQDEALARSNRAAVYLKLGKYTEALQDVSAAVKLMPTEIALFRKGYVLLLLCYPPPPLPPPPSCAHRNGRNSTVFLHAQRSPPGTA